MPDAIFSGVIANAQISIPKPLQIETFADGGHTRFAEFEPLAISYVDEHHYIGRLFETRDVVLGFDSMKTTADGLAAVTQLQVSPESWWAKSPLKQDEKHASVIVFSRVNRV